MSNWIRLFGSLRRAKHFGSRPFRVEVFERALAACGLDAEGESGAGAPVFLLATGWRTGSTLMQRMLMTDPGLMVWGEPYGRMALLPRITDALSALNSEGFWKESQISQRIEAPHANWIANAYPSLPHLRQALRAMLVELFARPAYELGYTRWGVKEVRCDYADAYVLRWLFPDARFLVMTRDPLQCYRSSTGLDRLWHRWPDVPVDDPVSFARHWNRLACSWSKASRDFPWLLVKFEELVERGVDLGRLQEFLALKLEPEKALQERIGGSAATLTMSPLETFLIRNAARPGMRLFDYA